MATPTEDLNQPNTQQIFVRADEIDAGTTIPSSGSQKPLSALSPADGANVGTTRPKPPPRPVLRREGSAPPPPPPSQPPPAPPDHLTNVTDSLSLPQLKQLVSQFPKTEQQAYAYQYQDAEDFVTEVDEWFHYTELEKDREHLLAAREAFEQRWRAFCQSKLGQEDASWTLIDGVHRRSFVLDTASDLKADDINVRQEAVATIYYLLLGVWSVNAGLETAYDDENDEPNGPEQHNELQIEWMHRGSDLVADCGVVGRIYMCLQNVFEASPDSSELQETADQGVESVFDDAKYREISFCLSCLYLLAESSRARQPSPESQHIRHALMALEPNLLIFLVRIISRLRWDEYYNIPLMHALHLFWKLMLVFFGETETHFERVKNTLQPRVDPFSSEAAHPILTASPLDYHLFRQEITSKYPSYNPPPPLIPLELEQKSMLPPPPSSARMEQLDIFPHQSGAPSNGVSILHQPVHIATPAPSPPPSPIGPGGKAGKKQNYQTNQNFPFLYPPLDSDSNNIGGKGTTEVQDNMVGKRWEGSDIPASIIEAGELFASRMRMTRAMRQLWRERDMFLKYERGWDGNKRPQYGEENAEVRPSNQDQITDTIDDEDLQSRLDAVKEFFHLALPDLQSLVIVMMKVMLANVQDVAARNGGTQEPQQNGLNRTKSNPNMAQSQSLPMPPPPLRPNEMTLEDLDNIRSREINQKAISGAIFLMLKWFKISHVLKFEYMTQLLLDSNYVQLTLKYFAHQNLEDLVAFKYDREDLSFWHYCHLHSDHPPLSPTSPDSHPHSDDDSSIDEAVPPPIQRHRRSPTTNSEGFSSMGTNVVLSPEETQTQRVSSLPSVDELGNPLVPLPNSPITVFSSRQFQTSIHLLRIMQKLTRSKSHRILLLVQFKSSQILRRVLRVPDPVLRLYVLKLFKSQVPYCGRKWRQSNMRVITAIYLHCRPELRDEWLAGMHDTNVEGEVDEAVPLEWALRGLTFWWMKRTYPDVMKIKQERKSAMKKEAQKGAKNAAVGANSPTQQDSSNRNTDINSDLELDLTLSSDPDEEAQEEEGGQEIDDTERDFFQRELDAMGWGMAALSAGEDVGFGEEAPGVMGMATNGINGDHNHNPNHAQHQAWEAAVSSGAVHQMNMTGNANTGTNMNMNMATNSQTQTQTQAEPTGSGGMEIW